MEKSLEGPLDRKEIKSVTPQGNQFWIFIWRTNAEAKVLVLWPLDVKSWLIEKDPDAGKDWRQEQKGMTEDKMVGWHHQLNVWANSRRTWRTRKPGAAAVHGVAELDTIYGLNNKASQRISKWGCFILLRGNPIKIILPDSQVQRWPVGQQKPHPQQE